jgi:hypothetical protein
LLLVEVRAEAVLVVVERLVVAVVAVVDLEQQLVLQLQQELL